MRQKGEESVKKSSWCVGWGVAINWGEEKKNYKRGSGSRPVGEKSEEETVFTQAKLKEEENIRQQKNREGNKNLKRDRNKGVKTRHSGTPGAAKSIRHGVPDVLAENVAKVGGNICEPVWMKRHREWGKEKRIKSAEHGKGGKGKSSFNALAY